jgi:hypothetical protein
MKNYTYGWRLKELGYVEVNKNEYTERQVDMRNFIELMSDVVRKANCGWSGVEYVLMGNANYEHKEPYMVLCVDGHRERWIPIDGNSKGCNISVLGENLW